MRHKKEEISCGVGNTIERRKRTAISVQIRQEELTISELMEI